jgi:hypothetical protein
MGATGNTGDVGPTGAVGPTGSAAAGPVASRNADPTQVAAGGGGATPVAFALNHGLVATDWTTVDNITFNCPANGTWLITYSIPVEMSGIGATGLFDVVAVPLRNGTVIDNVGSRYKSNVPELVSTAPTRMLGNSFAEVFIKNDTISFEVINESNSDVVLRYAASGITTSGAYWGAILGGHD